MSKQQLPIERLHLGWVLALVAVCLVVFSVQLSHISGAMPYSSHIDEEATLGPASQMVTTGSFHPGEFNYPSLPRYLAATGLAVGFLRSAKEEGSARPNIQQVQYRIPATRIFSNLTMIETAKQLFAAIAVIALAMTGVIAWRITRRPEALIIAPVILVSSNLFFQLSWQYVNYDIVGTCFVVLTVASCLSMTTHSSVARSAVVPAVWAGLAAASKYTLGLVFLPVLVGIWMYQKDDRRVLVLSVALVTVCVSFLAAAPFTVLDFPAFLNDFGREVWHYGVLGHPGFESAPGLTQFMNYVTHFTTEFGVGAAVLAMVGSVMVLRRDWRQGVLFLLFPILLLALLVDQKVIWTRNALPLHPLYAVAISYGVLVLHGWCLRWLSRWRPRFDSWVGRVAVLLTLLALVLPVHRLVDHAVVPPDSRNLARDWIRQNLPDGWTIVIPAELGFDMRGLADRNFLIEEVANITIGKHRRDLSLNMSKVQNGNTTHNEPFFNQKGREVKFDQQEMLALVEGPVVALVPVWGIDARGEAPVYGKFVGRYVDFDVYGTIPSGKRTLAEFGSNPVLVDYDPPTVWGDPRLLIVADDVDVHGRQTGRSYSSGR